MNPLSFITLTMCACAIAHYSVVFLEPSKASWLKAAALNVLMVAASNAAQWAGLNMGPTLEWSIYILVSGGLVWALYELKPLNNVTTGASYAAGSYLLAHAAI